MNIISLSRVPTIPYSIHVRGGDDGDEPSLLLGAGLGGDRIRIFKKAMSRRERERERERGTSRRERERASSIHHN